MTDDAQQHPGQPESFQVKALPTLEKYQRLYGKTCDGNDRKAMKLFKEYESRESLQRLTRELHAISTMKVADELCERVVGKTKKAKFESYAKWARMMLGCASSRA